MNPEFSLVACDFEIGEDAKRVWSQRTICRLITLAACTQAARVFIDEVASRGLDVMTAPGEAIHIDWVNTTSATPDELIEQASKTYLDWYMLTQVRRSDVEPRGQGSRAQG